MIMGLDWVTQQNDESNVGVGGDKQVQVAVRHSVDLIDDYDLGRFSESGLPSGHSVAL